MGNTATQTNAIPKHPVGKPRGRPGYRPRYLLSSRVKVGNRWPCPTLFNRGLLKVAAEGGWCTLLCGWFAGTASPKGYGVPAHLEAIPAPTNPAHCTTAASGPSRTTRMAPRMRAQKAADGRQRDVMPA